MAIGYAEDIEKYLSEDIRNHMKESLGSFQATGLSKFANKNLVVVSPAFPRHDITSSACRVSNILNIFAELGLNVQHLFFHYPKGFDVRAYAEKYPSNVQFTHVPADASTFLRLLSSQNVDYLWITDFWREVDIQFLMQIALDLKMSTGAKLIIDSVDFHCKKYIRKFREQKSGEDLFRSRRFLALAASFYSLADVVTVVSAEEKRDIEKNIPYVKSVEIVPNIHQLMIPEKTFEQRKHLCYVGNFGVNQNIDAVRHFIAKIFPFILEKDPSIEFHIVGSRSEDLREECESETVKVIGYVEDMKKTLEDYRVFVCPMIYGAGLKGKIGSAVEAGLPFVGTSIGVEGYPVKDGEQCFIADDPEEFASKCMQLYEDPKLWYQFSSNSMMMVSENYSRKSVLKMIQDFMPEISTPEVGGGLTPWTQVSNLTVAFLGGDKDAIFSMESLLASSCKVHYLYNKNPGESSQINDLKEHGAVVTERPSTSVEYHAWAAKEKPQVLWISYPHDNIEELLFLATLAQELKGKVEIIVDARSWDGIARFDQGFSESARRVLFSCASKVLTENLGKRIRLFQEVGTVADIIPCLAGARAKIQNSVSELLETVFIFQEGEAVAQEAEEQANEWQEKLARGEEALDDWDFDEAKEKFEELLEETDLFEKLDPLLRDWDLIEAEKLLKEQLPLQILAYCGMAVSEYVEGDKKDALLYLSKAASIVPFDELVQKNLAKICEDLGIVGLKEAVKAYQFVLEEAPGDSESMLRMANLFNKIGNLVTVQHFIIQASQFPPPSAEVWQQRLDLIEENKKKWCEELGFMEAFDEESFDEGRISEILQKNLEKGGWEKRLPLYQSFFRSSEFLNDVEEPKVSVVVASSQILENTLSCIKSIHEQKSVGLELIFVDNGGREGEFEHIRPYVDTFISLKKNSGENIARNIATIFAKAPIALFFHENCIPEASCVESHLGAYGEYEALAVRGKILPVTSSPYSCPDTSKYRPFDDPCPCPINIEGNTSFLIDAFFEAGGWSDEVAVGGGPEVSHRILRVDPDLRKQIYLPEAIIRYNYASSYEESEAQDKIEEKNEERLSMLGLNESYTDFWKPFSSDSTTLQTKENAAWSAETLQRATTREVLEQALKVDSYDARFHESIGSLYFDSGELWKGLGHLSKAIELSPLFRKALFSFVKACYGLNLSQEAIKVCHRYLIYVPDDEEVLERIIQLQGIVEGKDDLYKLRKYDSFPSGDF